MKEYEIKLRLRQDTEDNWNLNDPVIPKGEAAITYDNDNNVVGIKIGNGVNWSVTSYWEDSLLSNKITDSNTIDFSFDIITGTYKFDLIKEYATLLGDQTLSGTKTFDNQIVLNDSIIMQGSTDFADIHYTNVDANSGLYIDLHDNNDESLWLRSIATGDGVATTTVDVLQVNRSAFNYKNNVVLHGSNYNNYSPTLIGEGASGTWPITITGGAAGIGGWNADFSIQAGSVNAVLVVESGVIKWSSKTTLNQYLNLNDGFTLNNNISGNATTVNNGVYTVGDQTIAGIKTFTSDVQIPAIPINATSAASKSYIDNAITGITWKAAVKVATIANIILLGTQIIDNIVLVVNDRVLVKDQTTQAENGIYLVSDTNWTRTLDANTEAEIETATVAVTSGTINGDSQWTCIANSITINTTPITFGQISGSGTYSASTGLLLTGNAFAIDTTVVTLAGVQILSNKSISGSQITSAVASATLADTVTTNANLTGVVTSTGNATSIADAALSISKISNLQTALDAKASNPDVALKANIASPTFTGIVAGISSTMVGLGNLDNTSDANKPVSTATQTALDAKANDNAVVKIAGTQTITGPKFFSAFNGSSFAGQVNFDNAGRVYISSGSNRHLSLVNGTVWDISNANGASYSTAGALSFFNNEVERFKITSAGDATLLTGGLTATSFVKSGGVGNTVLRDNGSTITFNTATSANTLVSRGSVGEIEVTGILNTANTNTSTLTIANLPSTSIASYDILTRNVSTGLVEKISSTSITTDSSIVHISGTETITGAKTFTANLSVGSLNSSGNMDTGFFTARNGIQTYGGITATNSITAASFIKSGGSSLQFLKADGSVDASTYLNSSTGIQNQILVAQPAGFNITGTGILANIQLTNSPVTGSGGTYDVLVRNPSTGFIEKVSSASIGSSGGGTVTSVSGTGTVSGLTLSGTVNTLGNLILGGTLSLTTANVNGVGTITNSTSGTSSNITAYTVNQNLGTGNDVIFRDITASRGDGTGTVYLNALQNRYLRYDGTNYLLPGASNLYVEASVFATNFTIHNATAPSYVLQPNVGSSYLFGTNTSITGCGIYDITAGGIWRFWINDTTGNANFSSTVFAPTFTVSSDERWKTLNNKTFDLKNLQAKSYVWNELGPKDDGRNHYGYLAQEVEAYMPDAVYLDDNGFKTVNYTEVLVAEIAQLKERVKQLEELI